MTLQLAINKESETIEKTSFIEVTDMSYKEYWETKLVKESSRPQIASIMICDDPTKKNGGWSCGIVCNSMYQMHGLEHFEDGTVAYICTKHIDYDKFEYEWGIVKLQSHSISSGSNHHV